MLGSLLSGGILLFVSAEKQKKTQTNPRLQANLSPRLSVTSGEEQVSPDLEAGG